MRLHALLAVVLLAAACGDDPPPPPPVASNGAPPPPAPGAPGAKPKGSQLQPRAQIEDRVKCPSPAKSTGPSCTPGTLSCEAGLYCLPVGPANSCEPCAERDSIRHEFKDRDFVPDQVRDPFQSYVIVQPGLNEGAEKKVDAGPCNRPDQFVATNYSYLDLTLVGIVSKGTQRKVLMMDHGNLGHIIRRGDCVGKEKAVVKDIGATYVTFVVAPDPEDRNPAKASEEHSVQLHPKALQVETPPDVDSSAAPAPVVAPPGRTSPAPTAPSAPAPAVVTPPATK